MLITCSNCQKALNLADDKIPSRPFVLSCPSCNHRQQVDPVNLPTTGTPPTSAAPQNNGAEEVEEIDPGPDGFVPMPALRPQDVALLRELYPDGLIVNLTQGPAYQLTAGLRLIGVQQVQHLTDLESACETMAETEIGLLLIVMDKASAPPCAPLEPLHKLPMDIRRRTFVVLMAENVRSLDGQVAFFLQVNCLINSQDISRMPISIRRALLHHLRLYRAWSDDEALEVT